MCLTHLSDELSPYHSPILSHQLILALKSSPDFLLAEWSSVSLLYCNSLKNKVFVVGISFSHAIFTLTEHRKLSDLHFCLHGLKDSAHQSVSLWALESQEHSFAWQGVSLPSCAPEYQACSQICCFPVISLDSDTCVQTMTRFICTLGQITSCSYQPYNLYINC